MSSFSSLRHRVVLVSGAWVLAFGGVSLAETDADPINEVDDVIVVTATRTNLSRFDYPGLTSALALENLDRERPGDLSELLKNVLTLQVAEGPRRTGQTLSLRGLGRENVTLLIDGARQNFNSAHDGVLFLDPSLLGRVESVRGSAGALYGSGAAGGVIAFETLQADDLLHDDQTRGARASLGYRSVNEETRGSAAVFGKAGDFESIAAISLRQSGNIGLGSGENLPADDEIFSSLLAGGWNMTPALKLELGWLSFRNDAVEPNNGQGVSRVSGLNPLMNKDVTSDSLRAALNFDPESALIHFQTTVYHNISEVDEADVSIGRFIERNLTTVGIRAENRAEFMLNGLALALVTGAEWYEDEQSGFDSTTAKGRRGGTPDAQTGFTGAWAQLETRLNLGSGGELIILPGVRLDRFESQSDQADSNNNDAISPRLAATWAPNDRVRIFASWSEAFRAPSFNELYLSGTHFSLPHPVLGPSIFVTNTFIPNPDLTPEETVTSEIGAAFSHEGVFTANDRFEIKGAWFTTDATDLINLDVAFAFTSFCFTPPFFRPCSAGVAFSENLASAKLKGFEIALTYSADSFDLSGALYEVDGKDAITGDPLGALQPLMGHVAVDYTFENAPLSVGGRMDFADSFDKTGDALEERAGYAVLDLYAGWRPLAGQPLRLDLGVENVFDQDYERVFAGVSEPGRSVRLDVSWTGAW